ncbi:MAG: MGMT family protein [Ornithinimicrobium sp.]
MDEWLAEKVLLAVERIPPGEVSTYGDVGGVVGIGPRHVGNVLATYGSGVPWWRVVNAAGEHGAVRIEAAREHWDAEGIEVRPDGRGCRLARYRTDVAALAAAYEAVLARVHP